MYLLDTDVVSVLRRPDRHPAPTKWLRTQRPADVFISVVTLAELERGLSQQRRHDPEFARHLAAWMEQTTASFADRVIGVDPAAARLWGRMSGDIGPAHRSHGPCPRPLRGHTQRAPLRADGGPCPQSL